VKYNGDLTLVVRYTINDADPIQSETEITVKVNNVPEGGIDWVPFIIGGVILLVVLVPLFIMLRRKPRRWEELLPPPGPGPGLPPMVAPGGLPPGQVKQALPSAGAQPPSEKATPKQAEPPVEEEKPKPIRIKCPACSKVFKVTDNGKRPLHITCKHCGANGSVDQVPGDSKEQPTEEESPEEPKEEEAPPEPIPIVCPSCENLFELDEVTDTAKCPICGTEGDLDDGTISMLKEKFGDNGSVEMTLKCPSCAGTFKVKEGDTSIICPFCGAKGKASA
jgi:DNA-directed RNA polymerase subunit RPC12/RpoP